MTGVLLEATKDGVLLPVRAQSAARKNAVTGVHAGRLKVSVTQVAERGKANDAIMTVLSEALGLKRSQIELVAGPAQPQKLFHITATTPDELHARIAAAL